MVNIAPAVAAPARRRGNVALGIDQVPGIAQPRSIWRLRAPRIISPTIIATGDEYTGGPWVDARAACITGWHARRDERAQQWMHVMVRNDLEVVTAGCAYGSPMRNPSTWTAAQPEYGNRGPHLPLTTAHTHTCT